ncbi:MAG TPA: hypothetical protein VI589_07655, partial [Vicinamibacteria bacterium]
MRKVRVGCLAVAAVFLLALPVRAEDRFPEVEYISGKAGFEKKVKGVLTLDQKVSASATGRAPPCSRFQWPRSTRPRPGPSVKRAASAG